MTMNREARVEEPITLTPDVISSVFREEVRDLHVRQEETPVQRGLRLAAVSSEAAGQRPVRPGRAEPANPAATEQSPPSARVSVMIGRLLNNPNPPGKEVARIVSSPEVASRDLEPEQFKLLVEVQQWMTAGTVSESEVRQLPKKIRREVRRNLAEKNVTIVKDRTFGRSKALPGSSVPQQPTVGELPMPAETVPNVVRTERKITAAGLLGRIALGKGWTVRKVVATAVAGVTVGIGAHYMDVIGFNVTNDICDANSGPCLILRGIGDGIKGGFDLLPGGRKK